MEVDILRDILYAERFFYADCIVIDQSDVVGYKITNGQPEIDQSIHIEKDDLTDIFQNFSTDIAESTYVGGEASAHGSCGFFYKKTGGILNWGLMSLDSEPFMSVEKIPDGVAFVTNVGNRWVIHGDDIKNVQIIG